MSALCGTGASLSQHGRAVPAASRASHACRSAAPPLGRRRQVAAASTSLALPSGELLSVRASGAPQRRVFPLSIGRFPPRLAAPHRAKTVVFGVASAAAHLLSPHRILTGGARWATRWRFSSRSGSCSWEARHVNRCESLPRYRERTARELGSKAAARPGGAAAAAFPVQNSPVAGAAVNADCSPQEGFQLFGFQLSPLSWFIPRISS